RAAGRFAETFTVAEVHRDIADAHLCARAFRAERDGNSFIRLDVEDKAIGFDFFSTENDVGGALELNHDLRGALGEALACSQIKRHAGPAPVVDEAPHGDDRLGARAGADARLLPVARHRIAVNFSRSVLTANDGLRDTFQIVGADGLQDL